MKTLVIYHKADFDGLFSREICKQALGDTAEYLGWDYGDPVPVVEPDRKIIMVDISVDGLMDHRPLIWIDHHKSAMAKFSERIPGYRIDGVAACRLAWQYFSRTSRDPKTFALPDKQAFIDRTVEEPFAVQLAGEYDIWDKRNPDADVFQSALRAQPLTDWIWSQLFRTDIEDSITQAQHSQLMVMAMLERGRAVDYANAESSASLMRDCSFELQWEGLRFLAVNKPRGNSRTFAAGVKPEHDALLTFYWLRNKWRVSLYGAPAHPEHDLSLIAVKNGGGGHKQACGFECRTLPFQLP